MSIIGMSIIANIRRDNPARWHGCPVHVVAKLKVNCRESSGGGDWLPRRRVGSSWGMRLTRASRTSSSGPLERVPLKWTQLIDKDAAAGDVDETVRSGEHRKQAQQQAFVVYPLHYQFMPEERLAQSMSDLFGVGLSCATRANMSRNCASRLAGFAQTLRDLVAGANVKPMDEAGFRIGGKTPWLHVACCMWRALRCSPSIASAPNAAVCWKP